LKDAIVDLALKRPIKAILDVLPQGHCNRRARPPRHPRPASGSDLVHARRHGGCGRRADRHRDAARQHNPQQGQRAALGLILGNLIGGIAAAIVYNLVLLSNTLVFFIAACLAASLVFTGRIVTAGDCAPIYAIAFATFILLLGLGMSPLPGGSGEAFVSRLFNALLASALVGHWHNDRSSVWSGPRRYSAPKDNSARRPTGSILQIIR
jgi:hypothetical protein